MKVAVLSANLGSFDAVVPDVAQDCPGWDVVFHRFTDENFPPITGLTPRMQYRIAKLFGWQLFPGFDQYIWLDGSFSMQHHDSVWWFLRDHMNYEMMLFKHPNRNTIKQEVDHIEEYLRRGNKYITSRYANGLHKEQYAAMQEDPGFKDYILYTSTAFRYSNTKKVQDALADWWYNQSRYFTCDQIALPYIVDKHNLYVRVIEENQYKIPYLSLTSTHK